MVKALNIRPWNPLYIRVGFFIVFFVLLASNHLAANEVRCSSSYYGNKFTDGTNQIVVEGSATCNSIILRGREGSINVKEKGILGFLEVDQDPTFLGAFVNSGTVGFWNTPGQSNSSRGIQAARETTTFTNNVGGIIQGGQGIWVISVNDANHIGIRTLNNYGLIDGKTSYGLYVSDAFCCGAGKTTASRIETIYNFGLITGKNYGIYVEPLSSIGTLNNAQGEVPLTYSGVLPTFYNVILGKSAADYGKLVGTSVSGTTTFSIYENSKVMSTRYSHVLEGLSPTDLGLSGDGQVVTGKLRSANWTLQQLGGTGSIWDLIFDRAIDLGPSIEATQNALASIAKSFKEIFALQTAASNPGLSYDCSLFNSEGVCLSFGAKSIMTSGDGGDATSSVVVAGYRVDQNIRIGGFIEQRVGDVSATGIRLKSNNPEFGLYGVWTEKTNNEGLSVRVAARFGKNDIAITRPATDGAEPGQGTAALTSQALQLTIGNGYRLDPTWIATPFVGLRYLKIERSDYTEATVPGVVDYPLSYPKQTLESYTGIFGVAFTGDITERLKLTLSLGVDHDLYHRISDLAAVGVNDISAIKLDDQNYRKTRPVASGEMSYAIDKRSQISGKVTYREEAFQPIATTTAYIAYTLGF